MIATRRQVLRAGGGLVAALAIPAFAIPVCARAEGDVVEITMTGRPDGSSVWFDPLGLLVQPGQTVRWTNRDAGNAHTSTAYHPDNSGRPLRIPKAATPWASDYLLPGDSFSVTLTEPGVYDYYCLPHEHAGMVGRIVVGGPQPGGWMDDPGADEGLPEVALKAFPTVEAIIAAGAVRHA